MSEENPKFELYKKLMLGGLLILILIMKWIEKHPFTTAWLVCVIAFIAYLAYDRIGKKTPDADPPPSDHF